MKDKQALVSAVLLLHCAVAVGTPRLTEPAIVVAAATGTVLHAEAANQRWAPASLAKLMTLYLVFEALQAGELAANDRLTVSRVAAAQQPVRLGLRSGQALTVAEAIAAVAMVSANDVAVTLAERLAGSEARFAALMTATARRLPSSTTS